MQRVSTGLILNEDCNHFAYARSADEMTPEGVDALVDGYADGTQVSDLVFNPNAMRSSVASRVKQAFWEGFDPEAGNDQAFFAGVTESHDVIRKWVSNLKLLHERGIDPFERWLRRSRQHGVRGWISVRMNDLHQVDEPGHCMHDRFWQEHPEYWRVPWRAYEWAADRALDYEHAEVRAHLLAYIEECVERYDMDGLELDWMRQPWCFRPGHEEAGAALLTEFMRQVRALLDAQAVLRGHNIQLSVRVPPHPEIARRMGFDTITWAKACGVDLVIPTPAFGNTDFDMPIELWNQLLDNTKATLAPSLEISLAPFPFYPFRYNTLEQVRAAATTLLDRGADQIYLFNYMDRDPNAEQITKFPQPVSEVGALETMRGKARSHVFTHMNLWAPGTPLASALPYRCSRYGYRPTAEFRLPIGPAPLPTQPAFIHLGLETADAPRDQGQAVLAYGQRIHFGLPPIGSDIASAMVVYPNGVICPFAEALPARPDECGATHAYSIPAHALRRGDNVVEVSNSTETPVSVTWVEIAIKDIIA